MRAVDLFCGVGGLSKGLQCAGLNICGAYDNWTLAVETYSRNLEMPAEYLDLLDVDAAAKKISRLKPELIAGGPPCQDFSSSGNRRENERAQLTLAYASIIASCKPRFALMENVPRTRLSTTYAKARKILEKEGYSFFESVLNANLCNVPQTRKRFFMIAWRGKGNLGERFRLWARSALAVKPLTVKEYLMNEISIQYYYVHPRNYSRRAVFTVDEPSPTIRSINRPVPPNYKRNHLDSAPPEMARPLTSMERSRIQTFPKSWKWSDKDRLTKGDIELLIGNAVPVNLAKFVGEGVLHAV